MPEEQSSVVGADDATVYVKDVTPVEFPPVEDVTIERACAASSQQPIGSLGEALEVEGSGEVLGRVALPGPYATPIGLSILSHRAGNIGPRPEANKDSGEGAGNGRSQMDRSAPWREE